MYHYVNIDQSLILQITLLDVYNERVRCQCDLTILKSTLFNSVLLEGFKIIRIQPLYLSQMNHDILILLLLLSSAVAAFCRTNLASQYYAAIL